MIFNLMMPARENELSVLWPALAKKEGHFAKLPDNEKGLVRLSQDEIDARAERCAGYLRDGKTMAEIAGLFGTSMTSTRRCVAAASKLMGPERQRQPVARRQPERPADPAEWKREVAERRKLVRPLVGKHGPKAIAKMLGVSVDKVRTDVRVIRKEMAG